MSKRPDTTGHLPPEKRREKLLTDSTLSGNSTQGGLSEGGGIFGGPPFPSRPLRARVIAQRVPGRSRFVAQVGLTDRSSRQLASPFQKPAYQTIAAALRDLNGDGIFDAVLFSARNVLSRRKVSRIVRF